MHGFPDAGKLEPIDESNTVWDSSLRKFASGRRASNLSHFSMINPYLDAPSKAFQSVQNRTKGVFIAPLIK